MLNVMFEWSRCFPSLDVLLVFLFPACCYFVHVLALWVVSDFCKVTFLNPVMRL